MAMNESEHVCGFDCSSVHVSKLVTITTEIESELFGKEMITREVCPCCVEHPQGSDDEYLDCKNVFWEGMNWDILEKRHVRRSVGQCMCYSEVHGKRGAKIYEL